MLVQRLLQTVRWPLPIMSEQRWQRPLTQNSSTLRHGRPQAPQLATSLAVSVQVPPQLVLPARH
jgi:hypothetical protein